VKRTVLVLSIIAPILLYVIGGFFFAASGFGIDFEAPPTSPQRIVGALIGYIPGLVLTRIALARRARPRRCAYGDRPRGFL
jgi:Kef-type K+ transport system membrane component KefB